MYYLPYLYCNLYYKFILPADGCDDPLGMEDHRVQDSQITASSEKSMGSLAKYARLNFPRVVGTHNGAWCASSNNEHQWVQVVFGALKFVTGVITQGRPGRSMWVTKFRVQYGEDGVHWHDSHQRNESLVSNEELNLRS